MKLAVVAAALCVAVAAGTARAATWVVTSDPAPPPAGEAALLPIWQGAGDAYGIPWRVLAAINKIESDDGRDLRTSRAGAIGWMQFMPATWLRWGTDANGDGIADPWNADDAIYSAARYLAAAGGASDLRRALLAYNHADSYVQQVLRLAGGPGNAGARPLPDLRPLRAEVERAQARAAAAAAALALARGEQSSVGERHHRLLARSTKLPLLSARLAYQRLAALTDGTAIAARTRTAAAVRTLAAAESTLSRARRRLAEAARTRARRLAAIRRAQTARRLRAAQAARSAWAQQVPWFDGFAAAAVPAPGRPQLGAAALRVVARPAPVVRFTLNR